MGGLFDSTLEGFERSQGYEAVTTDPLGLGTSFRKPVIERGGVVGYVQIDACTFERDTGEFHEDPEKRLPYALCGDPRNLTHMRLDGRREAYVPKKPLLLLYKLKAFRDRQHDLRTKGPILSPRTRNWLQGKWIKDGADLISLLDPRPGSCTIDEELDTGLLLRIVENQTLQFALESLTKLPDMEQSLALYRNARREEVAEWVEKILEKT